VWRAVVQNNIPKMYAIAKSIVKQKIKTVVSMQKDGMRTFLMLLRLMDSGEEPGCMTRTMVIDMDAYTEGVSFKNIRRMILADIPPTYTQLIQLVGRASRSCAQMEMREGGIPEKLIVDAYMTVLDRDAINETLKDFRKKNPCSRGKVVDPMWYGPHSNPNSTSKKKPACKTIAAPKTIGPDTFRLDFFDGFTSDNPGEIFDHHVPTPRFRLKGPARDAALREWNAYRAQVIDGDLTPVIMVKARWKALEMETGVPASVLDPVLFTMGQQTNPTVKTQSTFKQAVPFGTKTLQIKVTRRINNNQPQGAVETALRNAIQSLTAGKRKPGCGALTEQQCTERNDCGAYWGGKCHTKTWKGPACTKRKNKKDCTGWENAKKCKWVVDVKNKNGACKNEDYEEKIDPHPMVVRLAKSSGAIQRAVKHNAAQNIIDMSPIPDDFKLQDQINKEKIEEDMVGIEAAFCALHTLSVDRFLMRSPSMGADGKPQCANANLNDMRKYVETLLVPSEYLMPSQRWYVQHGVRKTSRRNTEEKPDFAERYRKNPALENNSTNPLLSIMGTFLQKYTYATVIPVETPKSWGEGNFTVSMYHSKIKGMRFLMMTETFFQQIETFMNDSSKYIFVFYLRLYGRSSNHANIFAINKLYGTCMRFEPHGSTTTSYDFDKVDNAIKQKLNDRFPKLKYVRQKYWCPLLGVQSLESEFSNAFDLAKKDKDGKLLTKRRRAGYCRVHSLMFAYYFCAHPELDIKGVYALMNKHPEDIAKAARAFIVWAFIKQQNPLPTKDIPKKEREWVKLGEKTAQGIEEARRKQFMDPLRIDI